MGLVSRSRYWTPGVTPNFRLPNVKPGGDYINEADNGMVDCDGHGTLAGIINAAPTLMTVLSGLRRRRRCSASASPAPVRPGEPAAERGMPEASRTAVDLRAMARAVVNAVDLGAQAINISMTACMKALRPVDDAGLGSHPLGGQRTQRRSSSWPQATPEATRTTTATRIPLRARMIRAVGTIWSPSPGLVVSGCTDRRLGQRSKAPLDVHPVGALGRRRRAGEHIVSLGNYPDGRLVNGEPGTDGQMVPYFGSSFSTAYVTGLAALVRRSSPAQRLPGDGPHQSHGARRARQS